MQVGTPRALTEAGIEPDLTAGISVGSLNTAALALPGAESATRLREICSRMTRHEGPHWRRAESGTHVSASGGYQPGPAPTRLSPLDFSRTGELTTQAYEAALAHLDELTATGPGRYGGPGPVAP